MRRRSWTLTTQKKEPVSVYPVPDPLSEALDPIEGDHNFFINGKVCSGDIIRDHIKAVHENGNNPFDIRPYPSELFHYYDSQPCSIKGWSDKKMIGKGIRKIHM